MRSCLTAADVPIVPEHIWKDVSEKEVKNYSAEPEDGPVVGSGPFRLVEGEAGGSSTASRRIRTTGVASRTSMR